MAMEGHKARSYFLLILIVAAKLQTIMNRGVINHVELKFAVALQAVS